MNAEPSAESARTHAPEVPQQVHHQGTEEAAACRSASDGIDVPGCDTGPGGRLRFVAKELTEIVREWIRRRGSR